MRVATTNSSAIASPQTITVTGHHLVTRVLDVTPVMLPEEGPHAGRGVVERMAVIGQRVTSAEETVSARPALADEAERLKIRLGSTVLTIVRIYRTDERPVETADIVLPVERYSLVYEIPVG